MYPKPNRANDEPNFTKTPENDALDLGWAEGALSDGRPYRAECWAQDQITMVTFFFSVKDLEHFTVEMFKEFLVRERLIEFLGKEAYVSAARFEDDAGNEMWSLNVVIGTEDALLARDSVRFKKYRRNTTT